MALANFSLPYATPTPFLYSGNEGQVINNLRLNAVLPPQSAPTFNDGRQYRNDPYSRYQQLSQQSQQQQQKHQEQRFHYLPLPRGENVFTGTTSYTENTRYAGYDENFGKDRGRDQQNYYQGAREKQQDREYRQRNQQEQEYHQQENRFQQQQRDQQQNSRQQQQNQHQKQQNQQQQSQHQQQQSQQQQSHHQQQNHRHHEHQHQDQQYQHNHQFQQQQNRHQEHHQQQQQNNLHQRISFQTEREQANSGDKPQDNYPERPNGYTRVNSGSFTGSGAKTSVHAVLDYDDDDFGDYYDEENPQIPNDAHVTPIQGPIFLKNGSVPVVPLYSYPQLNNGTLVQIPILWTALSVALGVELRGDLIKGAPCIKKYHQLFCPTAGNTYPIERIEQFIDENKALMKRMYGDFEMNEFSPPRKDPKSRRKRTTMNHDIPDGGPRFRDDIKLDFHAGSGDSYFSKIRNPRQSFGKNVNESGRVDACESKVEIVTPYWSTNSAGKVRAIVNTQHFEQAIHQEVCSKSQTGRCTGDCGCEQKYKWHRLLAYDPDNDCKGIFMDWFLYPSCCVCRCDPDAKFPSTSTTTSRN